MVHRVVAAAALALAIYVVFFTITFIVCLPIFWRIEVGWPLWIAGCGACGSFAWGCWIGYQKHRQCTRTEL